ncbi:molybdopterin-guanine dinucleotide biosynthesis protein B [Methanobrevibacter gottschalkii]|uniref:Molybdopterin-guanine dinucleotide biosynthesis protein B n=1 Tax=Methanobrevibacter gottschalkii TaxID=190974 RepID=A0A1H7JZW4_9EURY|nr:molybdopterin-guanine dinucleotide biosynthesis protein B [Methanobrevibacter gottschalkii]SEK80143.1 molybdopterin-guanine dinucleotide biosynthesis protein B [Methanobrevibacter gottschalkii]
MKIVSIVGRKNTGKTSLTVKIIEELTKRGYNVASIKHSHHSMEMDKENTDTWKHKQAGSNVVVGIGSTTFFNARKEMDLNRLLFLIKHMDPVDFVVIEGFKKYNYPKIATSPDVVDEYTIKEINSFTIDDKDLKELVDIIEERSHDIVDTLFANNCGYNNGENIASEIREGNLTVDELDSVHSYLSIDNKVVGLNRFVSDFLKQNVLGVINTLNLDDYNVEKISNIELIIPNEVDKTPINAECTVLINGNNLKINNFAKNIVANSIKGMINSIKTEDNAKMIDIAISNIKNNELKKATINLKVNNHNVEINRFTQKILKETIFAIVNSLRINEEIAELRIKVEER